MTLNGKRRDNILDGRFISSAVEKISDRDLKTLENVERSMDLFEQQDRNNQISTPIYPLIFAYYSKLSSYGIYKDKSTNERIKRAIDRLEKLMRKYNIRGFY